MTAGEFTARIAAAASTELFARLYGAGRADAARERISALLERFLEFFGAEEGGLRCFSAPGRTELGGNHTDHNSGKVLAAAISQDILAIVRPSGTPLVRIRSDGFPDLVVDLADMAPREHERGRTEALVRGIAAQFRERGFHLRGFDACLQSAIPAGAGLSSSAAVEVLLAAIFDALSGDSALSALELARIGRRAENEWYGKPCGLMDQAACAHGGIVSFDFRDAAEPLVRPVACDPEREGFALCLAETGGSHADLGDAYAAIPREMLAVARELGGKTLRDCSRTDLLKKLPLLRASCGERAILRALHYFAENERVDAMVRALDSGDFGAFLHLARASGSSSWRFLQNVAGDAPRRDEPRRDGLALALGLVETWLEANGIQGAVRVHGGGFAGAIQVWLPAARVEDCRSLLAPGFGPDCLTPLSLRSCGVCELWRRP